MRRVVVTGMGIVSSIGNNTQEVLASLREAKSGIVARRRIRRARLPLPGARRADARSVRSPSTAAPCASSAAAPPGTTSPWSRRSATPGSSESDVSNERTGIIMGSGGPSTRTIVEAADITTEKGPEARRPVRGAEGDVVDRLGDARHLVQDQGRELFDLVGLRDLEPLHRQRRRDDPVGQAGHGVRRRLRGARLDACRCCSTPWARCRRTSTRRRTRPRAPTTRDRDGFVIAGGAGVLVLEELEHAKARGAKIYAEIAGYGATSDGHDMVAPSGEGAVRCMKMALDGVKAPVDYINPHATSTPIGDIKEIEAIREVFGAKCPPISATKSLTGHSLGAAGVQEAIYSLLMMQNGFICESANIENLDPALADMPIVRERQRQREARLRAVEFVRLRRHQRLGRVQAAGRIDARNRHDRIDERQARPGDGRRQRSLDRLGHRQGAGRPRRRTRLHLSGRGAGPAGQAARRIGRQQDHPALRCRGHRLGRCGVRRAQEAMGHDGLPGPRHRLLRQERAEGPLRRHHARELPAHHGDLLLLVHRSRQARRRR